MNGLTNIATNSLAGFIEDLTLVRVPAWWENPWVVTGMLAVLAGLGVAGFRLRARWPGRAPDPQTGEQASEPPHLWALRQLEALKQAQDTLGAYRFTIECSLVLRRYIEARFSLEILYQTTREFLEHARTQAALNPEQRGRLGRYLQFCDLVKFARRGASAAELTSLVDEAICFVKACIPASPPP